MLEKSIHKQLTELNEFEKKIRDGKLPNKYNGYKPYFVLSKKFTHDTNLIKMKRHLRFYSFPKHRHNFIEITYVYQGEMNQTIEGKKVKLKKGELIFLNQKIKHEIDITGENDVIINFLIAPEFLNYILVLFKKENIINRFLLSTIYPENAQAEYLLFHISKIKRIQNLLKEIIETMYNETNTTHIKIRLLIGLLIVELLNHLNKLDSYSEDKYDTKLIMKVLKYIDENYRNASLKTISAELSQQDYYISRVVKTVTGMTFRELLQNKRLEKAAEFLKNTDMSIETIIKDVGYENATHFYKLFKKKYNMSLKKYRDNF